MKPPAPVTSTRACLLLGPWRLFFLRERLVSGEPRLNDTGIPERHSAG